jgi:formylmethanofuran dehydrogenase subunit E
MDKKITPSENKKTKKMESVKCAKCGLEYSESDLSANHQNEAFY